MRVELYLAFAAWEKARQAAGNLPARRAAAGPPWSKGKGSLSSHCLPAGSPFTSWSAAASPWPGTVWPKNDLAGVAGQLQAARLALLAGNEAEGQRRIADLARQGGSDFRVLNSLGNLFFELHRAEQALPHYQRSLQLNPDQPALRERIRLIGQFERKTTLR